MFKNRKKWGLMFIRLQNYKLEHILEVILRRFYTKSLKFNTNLEISGIFINRYIFCLFKKYICLHN